MTAASALAAANFDLDDPATKSARLHQAALSPADPPAGKRPWFVMGDIVHMLEEFVLPAPDLAAFPKADFLTFSGQWPHLVERTLISVPARLSFTAMESWRDWMGMEAGPSGGLLWHVVGTRLAGPDEYAPDVQTWLQCVDPAFFEQAGDSAVSYQLR